MPLSMKRLKASQSHAELRPSAARKEISLPVNLISTTNMLSYEAPDLPTARQMMAARSSQESANPSPVSASDVPALTPDGSPASSSPAIEYNHLSTYFPGPTVKRSPSARQAQAADIDAPAIPKRVPSHSKREHERLARKRSIRSGKSSPTSSSPSSPTIGASDSAPQRTSLELIGVNGSEPPPRMTPTTPVTRHRSTTTTGTNSPFSPELEKLNEVVEDYRGVTSDTITEMDDEDTRYMRKLGLVKFAAADYCSDIGVCYPKGVFELGLMNGENPGGWI